MVNSATSDQDDQYSKYLGHTVIRSIHAVVLHKLKKEVLTINKHKAPKYHQHRLQGVERFVHL